MVTRQHQILGWKLVISHSSLDEKLLNLVSETRCSISSSRVHSDVFKENENMVLHKIRKHHCSNKVMKKARHIKYSQLTLKSFFSQPKAPDFMGTIGTDTPHIRNEKLFHETEPSGYGNITENIEVNHCELVVPVVNACGHDPDNINLCSSSKMETSSAAVLKWQRIQEKMKTSYRFARVTVNLVLQGLLRKVQMWVDGSVCAWAKGPESEPEAL